MSYEDKIAELYEFIGFKIKKDLAKIAITCSSYANEKK